MAVRPFAFGVRLRDGGRTLRVRPHEKEPARYVVEDLRADGDSRLRDHPTLDGALRDAAKTWRARLN